jgi:hypothetical protein
MSDEYESVEEVEEVEEESEEEVVTVKKKRKEKKWKVSDHLVLLLYSVHGTAKYCTDAMRCQSRFSDNDRSLLLVQDPNKPKRAMSAFFLYSQGNRARVKTENPEASFGDVVGTVPRSSIVCRSICVGFVWVTLPMIRYVWFRVFCHFRFCGDIVAGR